MALKRATAASALLAVAGLSAAALAQDSEKGKAVYARACESCHGTAGKGAQGPAIVPYPSELSELAAVVRQGIGLMPAMPRAEITDAEIADVYAYVKSLGEPPTGEPRVRGATTVRWIHYPAERDRQ